MVAMGRENPGIGLVLIVITFLITLYLIKRKERNEKR